VIHREIVISISLVDQLQLRLTCNLDATTMERMSLRKRLKSLINRIEIFLLLFLKRVL
jgi:hypothetical protein